MKKLVSFIVSVAMLISCLGSGICVFAAEENNDWAAANASWIASYVKQTTEYAGGAIPSADITYHAPSATVTTLFDSANGGATADTRVMLYVVNTNTDRVGTDTDEEIVKDLLGRGFIVLVVDYHNADNAVVPNIDWSLQAMRRDVKSNGNYVTSGIYADGISVDPYTYVLPAGYNITIGETYWSIDKHGVDGMLERIVEIWNSDFVGVHGGLEITLPDGTTTTVADYTKTGVPGVGGEGVDTIFECIGPDGNFIDMDLKMDIIYPTNPDHEVPVMVQASSSPSREDNLDIENKPQLTGFMFEGCRAYAGYHQRTGSAE